MSLKILKSVSVVGSMTLLSRISGLIRDVIFANILGDQSAADVFFVAFRIPNFFRRIFGEGAFSAAFIPVFTQYRLQHSQTEVNRFVELMTGRFSLLLLAVTLAGIVFAPVLVLLVAGGFTDEPEKYRTAVTASRITLPYVFFISLVALSAGLLNTCGRFAVPAATPILMNLCLIGAALLLVPQMHSSPIALSIGVLAAGLVQLLFQLPYLRKENLSIRPRWSSRAGDDHASSAVSKVFRLMVPAIFGVSVAQINVIINTLLASFLVTGSISWLYYSDRLMEFPVGVFGLALSVVILPHLSRIHSEHSPVLFSRTLDWAARWVILVCLPCTVGLVVLAEAMVSTIFFHGNFTRTGIRMTALSLIAFSLGLTAIVLVKVFAAGFYARQNTRTPVNVGMISMGLNILFCLILVLPLKHVGLALATSLSALFNAAMLYFLLRRRTGFAPDRGWPGFLLQSVGASAVMGLFLWWFVGGAETWIGEPLTGRIFRLGMLIGSGFLIYIAALWACGLRPASMMLAENTER